MLKIRNFLYEIFSVSFGLAILGFFGIMSFFPMEIMLMGEGQSWYWVFIFIGFGIVIAFFLQTRINKKKLYKTIRIVDLFVFTSGIFVILAYLTFTRDLLEPWLIQSAWFFRYNGFIVGIFLSAVIIKTSTSLEFLILKYNEEIADEAETERKGQLIALMILCSTFVFFILEVLLHRFYSLLSSLLLIFIIQICLFSLALPMLSTQKLQNKLELRFVDRKKRTILWLLIPLILVGGVGISSVILYFFNPIITFVIPYEGSLIIEQIPSIQFISILFIVLILIILVFEASGARAHRRFQSMFKRKKLAKVTSSTLGILDGLKLLGLIIVFGIILYYYDYPVFFPVVVSMYLLFGLFGALIYFFIGRTKRIKNILYIISILILIYNFYLTYMDGIYNVENNWSGAYDISFPFEYLHSWLNFALVGIPLGIATSDVFINYIFKNSDGSDSTNRSLLTSFAPFVSGMLIMPASFLLNNPGGDPSPTHDFTAFFLFCLILGIILGLGLLFHLITENFVPWIHRKKSEKNRAIKEKKTLETKPPKETPNSKLVIRKKAIAINIAVVVLISTFGGLAIFFTYQETYKKPLLAYSPGNYYVWLQNSSERVSKNIDICLESSPLIDAVDIYMAKNEYAAFQLVWRPLRVPMTLSSYQISDFVHQITTTSVIDSGNCSLRYEDFVIDEEFPDVLIPFSSLKMNKSQNHIFWFSLKTPYNTLTGVYNGNITFNFDDGDSEIIDIRLNVWNFTIPNMRHLRTNIGGQSEDPERIENYIYHRINDYGVSIRKAGTYSQLNTDEIYTCWLNDSDDVSWEFNWTYWDSEIEYKLNNSMNAFYVNYPYGWGGGPKGGRDPPIDDATAILRMQNWLKGVQAHLEVNNWLNYSYIYFIDEFAMFIPEGYSRSEYFNRLKIMLQYMKAAAPKIKIMTTTAPTEELELVRDYIDIYCPIGNERDKQRWDERMEVDTEFWFYMCVGPMAPYPNSHLYNRLYETRIQLWQVWLYNIHGFLYWSSTAYYHGHHGLAYNGYGDGWFIYERDGILYDSIRWENYLDAQEDYEYLWLLDATLSYLKLHPELIPESQVKNMQQKLDEIVHSVVGEKWGYCDHPSTMYSALYNIGEMLHELNSIINTTTIGEALWLPPYKPGA